MSDERTDGATTVSRHASPKSGSKPRPGGRDRMTNRARRDERHPPPRIDRLLSVAEAAERLGTTERFPRRLIAEGRIDYVKLGEGRNGPVRIAESALEAFISAGTVKAAE